MTTPALELQHVAKVFRKDRDIVRAVDDVTLVVEKGEFITFLGPSGCGKTTTLRMIAGFELPTEGRILIGGRDMTNIPANKRGIGFVFQNYALFPHMSVFHNVAYGLKSRGEDPGRIREKVGNALELVGLAQAVHRYPNQLSGGEQQRVALARVLALEPSLLLMDEPLSNLDAKLRLHMRTEIRRLQKRLGITCIYVTHDQAEALTMADRIMVMQKGKVEQIGTPQEIYNHPRTLFVADFIGQANAIRLRTSGYADGKAWAKVPGGWQLAARTSGGTILEKGTEAALVIRPERIRLEADAQAAGTLAATVAAATFVGSHVEYELDLGEGNTLKATVPYDPNARLHQEGARVGVRIDQESALFIPIEAKQG
ncbi:MAG: ABC transporter ATP-binding protein [Rectinemataceae bacterium]|nr:ABC transporter ATP-binding protein [Spirochaetaceae bacterium]